MSRRTGLIAGIVLLAAFIIAIRLLSRGPGENSIEPTPPPSRASIHEPERESRAAPPIPAPRAEETLPAAAPAPDSLLRLTGRVESTSGDAISHADVTVEAHWGGAYLPLRPVKSDADGEYVVELAPLSSLGEEMPLKVAFVGNARAPGFRSNHGAVLGEAGLPLAAGVAAAAPIVLKPGATIRGRVVDSTGAAVERALVALRLAGGDILESRETDSRGNFEIPIDVRAEGIVRAEKDGVGASASASVSLVPGLDVVLPDLELAGAGRIAGVVLYPDGAPVHGIELVARHESVPLDQDRVPSRITDDASRGEGLRLANAASDASGRFVFEGLLQGLFTIEVPDARVRGRGPLSYPIATGTIDARLVIDWHFVRIRVFGAGGSAVENARIGVVGWTREHRDRFEAAVASGTGPDSFFEEADFGRWQGGPGEMTVFAPRGGALLVHAKPFVSDPNTGILVADATFEVPLDSNESTLDLVAMPSAQVGRLRLDIRDARGRPVPNFIATLRGTSAIDYAFIRMAPDEDGFLPAVIAGKYVLEVEPGTYLVEHFVPIVTEVVVEAGRETTIPLAAAAGGRLNPTLAVPGLKPEDSSFRAKVEVLSPDGTVLEAVRGFFRLLEHGHSWSTGINPNEATFAGSVLAPGRYRVRVTAVGFELADQAFVVEGGGAADVTVDLVRQE